MEQKREKPKWLNRGTAGDCCRKDWCDRREYIKSDRPTVEKISRTITKWKRPGAERVQLEANMRTAIEKYRVIQTEVNRQRQAGSSRLMNRANEATETKRERITAPDRSDHKKMTRRTHFSTSIVATAPLQVSVITTSQSDDGIMVIYGTWTASTSSVDHRSCILGKCVLYMIPRNEMFGVPYCGTL